MKIFQYLTIIVLSSITLIVLSLGLLAISGGPFIFPPNLTILSPVNNTNYPSATINLSWVSNETLKTCTYDINNQGNSSLGSDEFRNKTIRLIDPNISVQADSQINSDQSENPGGNLGSGHTLYINSIRLVYMRFDLTNLTQLEITNEDIINATVFLRTGESAPEQSYRVFHVYNHTWNETNISYSGVGGHPCGSIDSGAPTNSELCNITPMFTFLDPSNIGIRIDTAVRKELSANNKNVSIFISGSVSNNQWPVSSKDAGDLTNNESVLPRLNITYMINRTINCNLSTVNRTISVNEGRHNITLYGNSSDNRIGQTTYVYFSTNQSPQWQSNKTNITSVTRLNDSGQFNVTLTDNYDLSNYIFSNNISGFWSNFSTVRINGSVNVTIIRNVTINQSSGKLKAWTVYFNDSISIRNQTDVFLFYILNIIPNATNVNISSVLTVGSNATGNATYYDSDGDPPGGNQTLWYINNTLIVEANNSPILSSGNLTPLANITFSIRFNDSLNYSNWVNSSRFQVQEIQPPTWSNNKTSANSSFPKYRDVIQLNATLSDDVALKNFTLTVNLNGVLNNTNRSVSGTSYVMNENFTVNLTQGMLIKWNVTIYDNAGNVNYTDTFSFVVRNTPPTVTTLNITNDTTVNFNNKTYYITGNGTFSDVDVNNVLLAREVRWKNGSTIIPNENGFSLNCTQYSNTYCAVRQNITAEMRVSDNSTELTNFSDWNVSNYIIIDPVYPISFANLTAGNVSDNEGDGNIEINWTDDAVQINETYRLYKSTSKINFSNINQSTLIGSGIREDSQFFKDNSTTNGTTYWYALVTVNPEGFYNESVLSLSFNATPNDTIAPKIPAGFNVTGSSDTATLSWANVTQDVRNNPDNFGLQYVIYYGTDFNSSKELANESITSASTKTVLGNSTTIAASVSGFYHFILTTLDDGANKNLSVFLAQNYGNASLTVSSSSSSSSSGGGGGGGGGGGPVTLDLTSSSHVFQDIAKGAETTLKVSASKTIAIFKIFFTPVKSLSSATFDIKEHTESTTPVSISGNVYQYIEIKLSGIKDVDISGASLQFKVSKNWINSGGYDPDKVVLNRYSATWVPLPTTKTDEDSDYIYYNSQSPGFSVFAVTAEKKAVPITENASIASNQTKADEVKQEPSVEQPLSKENEKQNEVCGNNACKGFEWIICPKDCYNFGISAPFKFKVHWLFTAIATISLFATFVIGEQTLQYVRKPKERRKPRPLGDKKIDVMMETMRKERIKRQFDDIKELQEQIREERIKQGKMQKDMMFVEKQIIVKPSAKQPAISKPAEILSIKTEKADGIKKTSPELPSIFSKLFASRPKEEVIAEKKIKLLNKFGLQKGKVFLVGDKNDKTSFGIFKEMTSVLSGLAVVRVNPATLGYKKEGVNFLWLSESQGENCINPSDIEDLYGEINEFAKKQKEGIVLLQGIDYIISGTNFKTLLRILRMLKDEISSRDNVIIVSFNQDLLNKEEAEKLKSEFNAI